jgi:DNA-directed RNA polymerase subunit beta'
MLDSGAKGSADDLRKLLIAIGLSINAKGEINDVIDRSGSEGLDPTQFFNYTSQAIVSQYKKSSETAIPGYLIRQLNTIASGVVLSSETDCGSNQFLKMKILDKKMLRSLSGKMIKAGSGLRELSEKETDMIGRSVQMRSPLYCKAQDGICATCYNPSFVDKMNLENNAGIGLLASTSLATFLTNLTLKAAHTGLSLDREEANIEQDIELFSE